MSQRIACRRWIAYKSQLLVVREIPCLNIFDIVPNALICDSLESLKSKKPRQLLKEQKTAPFYCTILIL